MPTRVECRNTLTPKEKQFVYSWLQQSYWANNRTTEKFETSIQNSLCFIALQNHLPVGFARIITDKATFAWLCDVIVAPEHRGQGIGTAIMQAVNNHPDLKDLRLTLLLTRDAHSLYQKFGYHLVEPGNAMARRINEPEQP